MYSDFVFLDRFLFELSCKNTHTHRHTHTDSNEYPIVAFSKNATIITELVLDIIVLLFSASTLKPWAYTLNKNISSSLTVSCLSGFVTCSSRFYIRDVGLSFGTLICHL